PLRDDAAKGRFGPLPDRELVEVIEGHECSRLPGLEEFLELRRNLSADRRRGGDLRGGEVGDDVAIAPPRADGGLVPGVRLRVLDGAPERLAFGPGRGQEPFALERHAGASAASTTAARSPRRTTPATTTRASIPR